MVGVGSFGQITLRPITLNGILMNRVFVGARALKSFLTAGQLADGMLSLVIGRLVTFVKQVGY